MTLEEIIPLSPTVQTVAWQQCFSLITDHLEQLDPIQRAIAANIAWRKAHDLTWDQCQEAARVYARVVQP